MFDFSQNTAPLGPATHMVDYVRNNAHLIGKYPDHTSAEARKAVADCFNIDPKAALVCNGSTEAIMACPFVFDASKPLLAPPTFWEYKFALERAGVTPKMLILNADNGFHLDAETFNAAGKDRTLAFLCNPNNPTSRYVPRDVILQAARDNPHCTYVVDETYLLFDKEMHSRSLAPDAAVLPNLVVAASMSKIFCVPGFRLGYCVARPDLTERINNRLVPYGVNTLAQGAVPLLLADNDHMDRNRELVYRERERMYSKLSTMLGVIPVHPEANFILTHLPCKDSERIINGLSERGIIVRKGAEFAELGPTWIRTSVRSPEENKALLSSLEALLA
jgi:threonine-phosphate decarboxylase